MSYQICINICIIIITNRRRTHVGKLSGISSLWTESGCWNTRPRWPTLQQAACQTWLSPYNRSEQCTNRDCNTWFLRAGLVALATMHSLNNLYIKYKCTTSVKLQYLACVISLVYSHTICNLPDFHPTPRVVELSLGAAGLLLQGESFIMLEIPLSSRSMYCT